MNHQSENSKKLNQFFSEEYTTLKTYVSSKLKSSVNRDPEDILQDVALKLFTGADRYSPIDNVAGFVYRALKNKVIDVLRSKPYRRMDYDKQNEQKLQEFAAIIYGTADNSYSESMKYALKAAIIDLKPDYRHMIIAIDFEGYSYRDLETETGIPIGTLMSRRHRAISQLFKKLKLIKEQNH
ncbi:MAG: RNA polymerase sigma factor [Psychroserpens sp.]|nr:RNA polymerase sigma factor [Psychroserpens sp.]